MCTTAKSGTSEYDRGEREVSERISVSSFTRVRRNRGKILSRSFDLFGFIVNAGCVVLVAIGLEIENLLLVSVSHSALRSTNDTSAFCEPRVLVKIGAFRYVPPRIPHTE